VESDNKSVRVTKTTYRRLMKEMGLDIEDIKAKSEINKKQKEADSNE
jgi:NACalpha-BTF3-like transcription factor